MTRIQINEPRQEADSPTASELVLALGSMNRAHETLLTAQARASGLGLLEFLILARAAEGEGVTPLETGRSLGLVSSTMTGLADRLEQEKLIRRAPHPKDRRLLLLKATPRGRKVVDRALGPLLGQLTHLADALQTDQRALLGSFIEEITALTLQHAKTARPRPSRRAMARSSVPPRSPQRSVEHESLRDVAAAP